jgi:hypothetical protein
MKAHDQSHPGRSFATLRREHPCFPVSGKPGFLPPLRAGSVRRGHSDGERPGSRLLLEDDELEHGRQFEVGGIDDAIAIGVRQRTEGVGRPARHHDDDGEIGRRDLTVAVGVAGNAFDGGSRRGCACSG